jgi:hypothetical protein
MFRYQLLCNLFEEGINPFAAYRGDGRPKPARFPVFVRNASDHRAPMSALIKDQDELDHFLKSLVAGGRPLCGLMVVEYSAEPGADGIWRKTETHRIGKNHSVHGQIPSDNWLIKEYGLTSDELQREEQAAVVANEVHANVRRAFDIAGVEWGRADHATFQGREIIYEINTAPYPQYSYPHGKDPIRIESMRIAFDRLYAFVRELDWGDGTVIRYRHGKPWRRFTENRKIRRLLEPILKRVPESQLRRLIKRIAT